MQAIVSLLFGPSWKSSLIGLAGALILGAINYAQAQPQPAPDEQADVVSVFDKITLALVAGTALAWIAWDVVLGARHQKTESMWLAGWAREWSALPFAVGALVGHWFVQNPNYDAWPLAVVALGAVLAWDVARRIDWLRPARWLAYPGLWLLLGIPVGFLWWPQRYPGAP
jgi:hypothetical protein